MEQSIDSQLDGLIKKFTKGEITSEEYDVEFNKLLELAGRMARDSIKPDIVTEERIKETARQARSV